MSGINQLLKEARRSKKLAIAEVAERTGIKEWILVAIESGRRQVSISNLEQLNCVYKTNFVRNDD